MKNKKTVFAFAYIILVAGQVSTYKKQYGLDVLSLSGIIDCFVFPLLGSAIITAIISLVLKTYSKVRKPKA